MTDAEEQEDELVALNSIYENVIRVTKEGDLNGGELLACPVLPDDFIVKIVKHSVKGMISYGHKQVCGICCIDTFCWHSMPHQ